jgi:hypothetical protein
MNISTNDVWTADRFLNHALTVSLENSDRRDAKDYGLYGAFHAWKAENTNFHAAATSILKSEELDASAQNQAYTRLVIDVAQNWVTFCEQSGVSTEIAVSIAHKYLARELSKIQNWISKTA